MPGDRASLEPDDALVFHGRGSRVINIGGETVLPEEVEQVLLRQPGVADAIVGVLDERFGQRITAVVALTGSEEVTLEGLRAAVGRELADYKRRRQAVFAPEVSRSPAGKADLRWATAFALISTRQECAVSLRRAHTPPNSDRLRAGTQPLTSSRRREGRNP